ncbi:MAG: hypothetical protein Q9216_002850 [Gyalolechia sp. 2 TL-2023]
MEQSPVIIAQNHARNAANASNPAAAGAEHEQAASQFAAAAKSTNHPEALRTLKLLEQHHQKLANLLKFRSEHPPPPTPQTPSEQPAASHVSPPATQQPREGSPYHAQPQTVPLPQRDISSSIASNLASARGIPSNRQRRPPPPPTSSQPSKPEAPNPQRRSKLIEEAYQARNLHSQKLQQSSTPSATPSNPLKSKPAPVPTSQTSEPATPKPDEPFQRFYSTFESLFSKLSAPLAFAGLPLNPDEPQSTSSPPEKPPPTLSKPIPPQDRPPNPSRTSSRRALEASQRASADPDYSALFSRAALRAVADEHGPSSVGGNESFYVVPTSGHTLAYADILARQHRERNHDRGRSSRDGASQEGRTTEDRVQNQDEEHEDGDGDGEFEGDEDLFVDARENPLPPSSPDLTRKRGLPNRNHQQQQHRTTTKTMEELHLENQAMKALLDQTSRRLLDFEMSAQTSSVALQRSIRHLSNAQQQHPPPPHLPPPTADPAAVIANGGRSGSGVGHAGHNDVHTTELEDKLRGMEEEVLGRAREMRKVERENEKLRGVVGRYRERFETIKAGARARREEEGKGGGGRKEEG